MDDFGIGYSSFSYLRNLPIDILKIDQSFVRDIIIDKDDAAIVSAILAMAHTLNLIVVAEGVETLEQLQFLRARRCDFAQGYLISRPLPEPELRVLLRNYKALMYSVWILARRSRQARKRDWNLSARTDYKFNVD